MGLQQDKACEFRSLQSTGPGLPAVRGSAAKPRRAEPLDQGLSHFRSSECSSARQALNTAFIHPAAPSGATKLLCPHPRGAAPPPTHQGVGA